MTWWTGGALLSRKFLEVLEGYTVMIVVMHGYGCKAAHSGAGRVSRETVNTEKRGKKQPWTNNGIC